MVDFAKPALLLRGVFDKAGLGGVHVDSAVGAANANCLWVLIGGMLRVDNEEDGAVEVVVVVIVVVFIVQLKRLGREMGTGVSGCLRIELVVNGVEMKQMKTEQLSPTDHNFVLK